MPLPDLTGQNIQDTYQRLIHKSASGDLVDGTGSAVPIKIEGNNVRISGSLIAQDYIVSSSVTNVTFQQQSGSTIFGDSIDDTHLFTGSLKVTVEVKSQSNKKVIKENKVQVSNIKQEVSKKDIDHVANIMKLLVRENINMKNLHLKKDRLNKIVATYTKYKPINENKKSVIKGVLKGLYKK